VRVGGIGNAFDSLECVSNAIIHPLYGFESSEHFDLAIPDCELSAQGEGKHQTACENASHQAQWTSVMHPIVVNEPLKENGNDKHKQPGQQRPEPNRNI
jgi:hypothetical protein